MLLRLATPAGNVRGPQYLAAALTALNHALRHRPRLELLIGRDGGQVSLNLRTDSRHSGLVQRQLQSAYPDMRIEAVGDDALTCREDEVCLWTRLRLVPRTAQLVSLDDLLDPQERQFVDPLAGVFAALSSRRTERVRPLVSLAVLPAGRVLRWWLARRPRAAEKVHGPLWIVSIRLAVITPHAHRQAAVAKLHELAGVYAHLVLAGEGEIKTSRVRSGNLPRRFAWFRSWLLSPHELALLWHSPMQTVRTPQLHLNESREFEPPPRDKLPTVTTHPQLALLGRVAFRDRRETFGILPDDRFRHLYLVGQTGTGKSTLLLNLAASDIAASRSVVLLDPHGDLCEQLLSSVPRHRTNDLILFDPSQGHPVTYNPLACRDPRQRPLVASAVVTSFRRLFGESWGPRLEHILRNCLLTLLENNGTTLVSLHQLLTDEGYRKLMVSRVSDDIVRSFWRYEFESWKPNFRAEALAPVQNKVGALVTNPVLRAVLGDPVAKLDLRQVIDSRKALLCNLSKGRLGEDAATLLGSLLVADVQLAAMSRADQPESERAPAFLFLDEFQNYLTSETIPTLLAEMRKYRLAVTIAHQHLGQLDEATAAAVFGNAGSLIAFRLGQDAETFAEQFGGDLLPSDFRFLPKYHAYVRLLIDGMPCRPFSMRTLPPPPTSAERNSVVRRTSRHRYGTLLQRKALPTLTTK